MSKEIEDNSVIVVPWNVIARLLADKQLVVGENVKLVGYPKSTTPPEVVEMIRAATGQAQP